MPKVTYIEADETEYVIDVPLGMSIMEGAINNLINGIEAECGGECACATCHVYVDSKWLSKLSPPSESERDMLECAADELKENSRLSCQLEITEELDGIVVRLPELQS